MLKSDMELTVPSESSWSRRLGAALGGGRHAFLNFLRHRDLLWQMVGNDIRGRYVGSLLGLFWTVVHPLVQIAIYTLIFSQIMGARLGGHSSPYAYSIYLCAGLLPWTVFAEVIQRSTGIFWEHANVVKKIAFPKVLLHAYVVTAGAVNLAIMVTLFLLFLWIVDAVPPLGPVLLWGGVLLVQLLFAMGIGFVTSVLNVFFRDVAQLTAVCVHLWFWLTPIVYVVDIVPPEAAAWLRYNVMFHFAQAHHTLVVQGQLPTLEEGLFLLTVSFFTLMIGLGCFHLLRRRIPDEL
jgi:lipopolysaccharide transport system permease protein